MNDQFEPTPYNTPPVLEHAFTAVVRPFGQFVRVDVTRDDEPTPFLSTVGLSRHEAMTRTNCALVSGWHLPPGFLASRLKIQDSTPPAKYRADRRNLDEVVRDRIAGTTFAGK